jgi:hypothetical protein
MTIDNWLSITNTSVIIVAVVLAWWLDRIPKRPHSPHANPIKKKQESSITRVISRKFLILPWLACVSLFALLLWHLRGSDAIGRSGVLVIVLYSFAFLASVVFVLFAHAILAIVRVVDDRKDKPS